MKRKLVRKITGLALTLGITVSIGAAVSAHGVYFDDRLDTPTLVLGEGPYDNAYQPSMVTALDGYSVTGAPMTVDVKKHASNITIQKSDTLGRTVTFFDYGHFTKDASGTMHAFKTFTEVPNAVKTTHAIKYNIHYWQPETIPTAIDNVPIQIIPSVNPLTLRKGDTFTIQVLKDGKPYSHAPLIGDVINDLTNESEADEHGRATLTVHANGLNVIGVEVALPTDDPHTQNKYFSSLSFIIDPE